MDVAPDVGLGLLPELAHDHRADVLARERQRLPAHRQLQPRLQLLARRAELRRQVKGQPDRLGQDARAVVLLADEALAVVEERSRHLRRRRPGAVAHERLDGVAAVAGRHEDHRRRDRLASAVWYDDYLAILEDRDTRERRPQVDADAGDGRARQHLLHCGCQQHEDCQGAR